MSRDHKSDGRLRELALGRHDYRLVEGGDDDAKHNQTTDRELIPHAWVVVPRGVTRADAARRWRFHEMGNRHDEDDFNDAQRVMLRDGEITIRDGLLITQTEGIETPVPRCRHHQVSCAGTLHSQADGATSGRLDHPSATGDTLARR